VKIQLLSDLHLESEAFDPLPAPGAEVLVLAGDIDASWRELSRFAGWPVPVIFVPGNHEFDRRELDAARAELRAHAEGLGLIVLDDSACVLSDASGRRVRFLGSVRWSDFDTFGPAQRDKALRAATYFQKVMGATWRGETFDAAAVRVRGLQCRAWLAAELALGESGADWDATVVITHFAPSPRSLDPRYGRQPTTASFCNDDEALIPLARLWLHGHLHCRHDYRLGHSRVVCNPRGIVRKGEADGYDPFKRIDVFSAASAPA